MDLLDTAENLVKNTTLTILATPTPMEALVELPSEVVGHFWTIARAATNIVERARAEELAAEGSERENLEKLCSVLTRALKLCEEILRRAAVTEPALKRELERWKPEPRLEQVLLRRYFYQVRGLLARVVEYTQHFLDTYDRHPVFIMDLNMLLDAIERFTGYVRDSAGTRPQADNLDTMYLLRAIAGEVPTWYDRTSPFVEFKMLSDSPETTADKWKDPGRNRVDTQRYLSLVWSGASAAEVADLRAWQRGAWADAGLNPRTKLPRDLADFPEIQNDREDREIWFFINGVVTDHWIAQLNAEHLADIFKRPIHILHNPTEGLHRDIRECVRGRVLQRRVRIAKELRNQLLKLAANNGKIVVIAHSQGTILASEIVKELRDRGSALLPRMEVFNFAFCADEFPDGCCRHVEHFANENDLVASLSLTPENPYDVPGQIYRRKAWGHFLGAHYLDAFSHGAYKDAAGNHRSVLFNYIGGANYGV